MSDELLYEISGGIATMTLNRPAKRNALSQEMILGMHQRLDEAREDPAVRAICLAANGDKSFCAGADLGNMHAAGPGEEPGPKRYANLLKKMCNYPKPLVAKVGAPCLAGGLGIMLACDIIIARDDVFFRAPEVNIGIYPFMVGVMLYRNVTWKKAVELSMTGRKVSAAEAEAMGLITRAVPADDFEADVAGVLEHLAGASPSGMKLGKEAFRKLQDMELDQALDYLSDCLMQAAATEDAKEGMMAFLEKRKPQFKGN